MELHLTSEQETYLCTMAQRESKNSEQLVLDMVLRLIDNDRHMCERVREGIGQADRGEFIEEAEMDRRFRNLMRR